MDRLIEEHQLFFQDVVENLFNPLYFVDKERRIQYWNRGAERVTGYSREEVLGKHCSDNILVHVDDAGNHLCLSGCPLAATLNDGQLREADVFLHHKNGHRVPISVRVAVVHDTSGEVVGAVEVFTDRSSQMELLRRAEELEQMSLLDTVTGIGNRRFSEMTLQRVFDEFHRNSWPFGVFFADIDHFKQFNDVHGHALGDQVLRMAAETMRHSMRSYDYLGRWGGEEFLGIIPNANEKTLSAVVERCRMLVENSFLLENGDRIGATVSMGAAIVLPEDTPETLVARADRLMYVSKAQGRNRVTLG